MKILIVTETIAGKGHERAAEVLKNVMTAETTADIKIVCLLRLFNKTIENVIHLIYMTLVRRFPYVWHTMYKRESNLGFLFKNLISTAMHARIRNHLDREQPELIIATHAAGLGALVKYKQKHNFRLAAVFTDFQVNSFWIYKEIDYYFVAAAEFKQKLVSKGIEESRIYVTGIPIDPLFSQTINSQNGLTDSMQKYYKILIMGGGLGLGGIREVIFALKKIRDIPIELTVITGSNKKLYHELLNLKPKIAYPMHIYAYVDDIYSKMLHSHLLITKPGGLTISEALAVQIPILIYKPIPGQEEQNLKFLIKKKAAIRVNNISEMNYWIKYTYNNPKIYSKLKEHQRLIAKPNSSIAIAEILLNKMDDKVMQK